MSVPFGIEGPVNANVANVYDRLPIGGEFLGYNGDCTEYSLLAALQACRPDIVPDGATFKTLLNSYTAQAINAGQASAQGAMTVANLVWLCVQRQIPYAQHDGSWFRNGLGSQGGYGTWPVVLQVSNGSAIPGNQGGVNGHAVTILAWDGGQARATIANGDSANGRNGQLDVVSFTDIDNAQPFALTEIRAPRLVAPSVDLAGIRANAQAILQKAGG